MLTLIRIHTLLCLLTPGLSLFTFAKAASSDAFFEVLQQSYNRSSNAQPQTLTNLMRMAKTLPPADQSDAYVRMAELSWPNALGLARNYYLLAYRANSNSVEALYGLCVGPQKPEAAEETLRLVEHWRALDVTNALPYYLNAVLYAERKDCKKAFEEVRRGNALGVARHRPLYLRIFESGQLHASDDQRAQAKEEFFLRQILVGARLTAGYMTLRECAKTGTDGEAFATLRDLVALEDTIGLAEPVLSTSFIRSSVLAIGAIQDACQLNEGPASREEYKTRLRRCVNLRKELLDSARKMQASQWNSDYVKQLRNALRLALP